MLEVAADHVFDGSLERLVDMVGVADEHDHPLQRASRIAFQRLPQGIAELDLETLAFRVPDQLLDPTRPRRRRRHLAGAIGRGAFKQWRRLRTVSEGPACKA